MVPGPDSSEQFCGEQGLSHRGRVAWLYCPTTLTRSRALPPPQDSPQRVCRRATRPGHSFAGRTRRARSAPRGDSSARACDSRGVLLGERRAAQQCRCAGVAFHAAVCNRRARPRALCNTRQVLGATRQHHVGRAGIAARTRRLTVAACIAAPSFAWAALCATPNAASNLRGS
jgi:hypothetical protein